MKRSFVVTVDAPDDSPAWTVSPLAPVIKEALDILLFTVTVKPVEDEDEH